MLNLESDEFVYLELKGGEEEDTYGLYLVVWMLK
jgi:hypothetical protein